MAAVCQNKNRRWCLMYDNINHRCHGLDETNKSKNCTFFKDRRQMTAEEREKYKAGLEHGFYYEVEERGFSSFRAGRL